MKKGFMKSLRPTLPADLYGYVWFKAMVGKLNVLNEDEYEKIYSGKRGLVHVPSLKNATIQENGSFFRELLDQLTVSSVNFGAPVMIDMWDGEVGYQIHGQLDTVSEYVRYISEHWGLSKKPLLRLSKVKWDAYCDDNLLAVKNLMNTVDILVSAPNYKYPPVWDNMTQVNWFEYYTGIIAFDESGTWLESPSNPDVVIDPEDPEDPIVPSAFSLRGWKMKFTGKVGRNDVDVTGEFFKEE